MTRRCPARRPITTGLYLFKSERSALLSLDEGEDSTSARAPSTAGAAILEDGSAGAVLDIEVGDGEVEFESVLLSPDDESSNALYRSGSITGGDRCKAVVRDIRKSVQASSLLVVGIACM